MKLPLFLIVFLTVYIHFWIRTRIRNPRVMDPDPAKVPDPSGSGSTTLLIKIPFFNVQEMDSAMF
jgi:hypothetical protein